MKITLVLQGWTSGWYEKQQRGECLEVSVNLIFSSFSYILSVRGARIPRLAHSALPWAEDSFVVGRQLRAGSWPFDFFCLSLATYP